MSEQRLQFVNILMESAVNEDEKKAFEKLISIMMCLKKYRNLDKLGKS